jgi:hypothetical protein
VSTGRRKLSAVDDPLAFGGGESSRPTAPDPNPPAPATGAEPSPRSLPALFVRLPPEQFDALARAAFELKLHKREVVAALVWRHVQPTGEGLVRLRELVAEYRQLSR